MKFAKYLAVFFAAALVIVSCTKEYSVETGGLGNIGTNQWEFKQGSTQYKGTMDTAKIDTVAGVSYLTLTGVSDSSNQLISLTVFGTSIKAGTYTSPSVAFSYTDISSNIIYQNDVTAAGAFTLVISKLDSLSVSGTFSGSVKDASSLTKTIASGKFSAQFRKKDTSSASTNCKIEKILEYDSTGRSQLLASLYTYNTSNRVNRVQFYDSSSGTSYGTFNLTFPTNRIQVDANQYFITDASGRITQFFGYQDPTSDTTDKIVATYTYNSSGQLTQRKQASQANPLQLLFQIDYTWSGGNLTKAEAKVPSGATTFITLFDAVYQYDNSKTAKNFLYLNALAFEILYMQPAVNAGSTSANALVKATTHYYNTTGTVTSTKVTNFNNSVIDANHYVQSFVVSGDDFAEGYLYSGEKYVFKYRCF